MPLLQCPWRRVTAQALCVINRSVIDRDARDRLAEEIRHFVAGLKDNFEFDDAVWSIRSSDVGVVRVRAAMWHVYDDLRRHKLKNEWAMSEKRKEIVLRCILFLKTDDEYRWPERLSGNPIVRLLLAFFTLGLGLKFLDKKWAEKGASEVWPFLTMEEFKDAKQNPVYLARVT